MSEFMGMYKMGVDDYHRMDTFLRIWYSFGNEPVGRDELVELAKSHGYNLNDEEVDALLEIDPVMEQERSRREQEAYADDGDGSSK